MHISIQSYGRPENVTDMLTTLSPYVPTWYVPESQAKDYENHGANVRPVEEVVYPMKSYQNNLALEDGFAQNKTVVCVDDDFKTAYSYERKKLTLAETIDRMNEGFQKSRFKFGGCAGVSNCLFLTGKHKEFGNVIGGITFHKPHDLRYDVELRHLEDLDMCIAQHLKYGGVHMDGFNAIEFKMVLTGKSRQTGGFGGLREKNHDKTIEYFKNKYSDNPFIVFPDDSVHGDIIHEFIQWEKISEAENTIERFF